MTETQTFTPDRNVYIRSQVRVAAMAMAGAMGVLWLLGDPNIWVGAVAGLGAIGLRGWYLASEEMAATWQLDGDTLHGPSGRVVRLKTIERLRSMGNVVQIITHDGDKHLIKYLDTPADAIASIEFAMRRQA